MADKKAPESFPVRDLLIPLPGLNSAMDINRPDPDFPSREMPYNQTPDEGLASRRSKHVVRTWEQVKAATDAPAASGYGLSLRSAMAGQCENDQFPFTNPFGKQRA